VYCVLYEAAARWSNRVFHGVLGVGNDGLFFAAVLFRRHVAKSCLCKYNVLTTGYSDHDCNCSDLKSDWPDWHCQLTIAVGMALLDSICLQGGAASGATVAR
jgi:hypothetical protein